jgi:hypothetical protein
MLVGAAPTDGIGAGWCRHSEYGRDKCATIAAGGERGRRRKGRGRRIRRKGRGGECGNGVEVMMVRRHR